MTEGQTIAGDEGRPGKLDGLCVLVVEDVAMMAWQVRDALVSAGANVAGPVPSVARALELLADKTVDAAVLDKNLDGDMADPIADTLIALDVPFVFLTGYGSSDTQGRHGERLHLGKPLKPKILVQTVADLIAGRTRMRVEAASLHHLSTWDGRPADPETSNWHWVEDADGLRPLLWRGDDWPERVDRGEWRDGFAVLSIRDMSGGRYHGPVAMPPRLAALFRSRVLAGTA